MIFDEKHKIKGKPKIDILFDCCNSLNDAIESKRKLIGNIPKKQYDKISIETVIFDGKELKLGRSFIPPRILYHFNHKPFYQIDGRMVKIKHRTPCFSVYDLVYSFEIGMAFDWIHGNTIDFIEEGIDNWY